MNTTQREDDRDAVLPGPTERLAFRPMTDADLDALAELLGDPDVMRYYPHPKSRTEAQAWIDWTRRHQAEHGFALWVIEDRASGAFVGDCGLTWQRIGADRLLEVGYHVLPAYQGRGLATEAARACLRYAFEVLGADSVSAIIHPDNAASRRVAEHLGMTVQRTTDDRAGNPVVVYGVGRTVSGPSGA